MTNRIAQWGRLCLIRRLCLSLLLLTTTTSTGNAFRPVPGSLLNPPRKKGSWGLALGLRGGADDKRKPSNANNGGSKKKTSSSSETRKDSSLEEEDDVWEDAREVLQDDDDDDDLDDEDEDITEEVEEEEEDDWTEVEVMGEKVKEVRYPVDEYDAEEEENLEEEEEEEAGEQVPLSDVLLAEQQEEEEAVGADSISMMDENSDDFVDALQDGIDIDMISSSMINTDDESSSANVDRMDLADAYDEELLEEDEEEEQPTPVLATGTDDDNHQVAATTNTNDYGGGSANKLSPRGGTDDESTPNAVEEETPTEEHPTTSTPASAASASEQQPQPQMTTVITDEMRKALKELHWKKREIRYMRPDMAAVVVAKKLRRPREGMPASFYTAGNKPTTRLRFEWDKVVKRVIVPVGLVAVAIYAGSEVDWEDMMDSTKPTTPAAAQAEPPSYYQPPVEETTAEETPEAAATDGDQEGIYTEEDDQPLIGDHKGPHSIKPYSKPVDVLDETWLDKLITKIENFIKGIWTKEL